MAIFLQDVAILQITIILEIEDSRDIRAEWGWHKMLCIVYRNQR